MQTHGGGVMGRRVLLLVLAAALCGAGAVCAQDQLSADRIFIGAAGCVLRSGSGTPEASVVGSVCDTFVRSDTGDIYSKQSGTGNTGWTIVPRLGVANTWTAYQTFTPGVLLANGSSSSPSLSYSAESTIGWYRAGAADVRLASNGIDWLRANGTLGMLVPATFGSTAGTSNYVSQTTGWRIDAAGAADVRYLYTDEMRAKLFTADLESVLAGSQRVTKSYSTVSQTFTCPATGSTATLWVFDSPTFGDAAVFVSGDSVVLHSMTRTGFGPFTIGDCVGVVTVYADGTGGNAGQQSWTFTRNTSTNGGSMTGGTSVAVNQLVQDMGTTGNGYVETTAFDGTANANAPYMQIVTWATSPIAANLTTRCRVGNLKGITSTTEYGMLCGNFSGNAYVRLSDQNAEIRGIPLKLFDGATETVRIDPTVPSIALGNPLPSAYGTGTGVWMGKDTGAYKFRVGNPAGNQLTWDGSALTVTGTINASSGTIGGFTIGASSLSALAASVDWSGRVDLGGTSTTGVHLSQVGNSDSKRIWIGNNTGTTVWAVHDNGSVDSVTSNGNVSSIFGQFIGQEGATGTGYSFSGDSDTYYGSDSANRLTMVAGATRLFWDGGQLFPETDNAKDLGHPSFRWRTVYAGTGTINTSDARVKKDINGTAYGREFLLALRPVDYKWKNATWGKGVYQGFLAQDVAALAPSFGGIHYGDDGVADGLNYMSFIAPIVRAFQQQDATIRALESRLRALEGRQAGRRVKD
jgi:hypothetical protein